MLKLIQWQWNEYHDFHRSRKNLLIHIFAVPLLLIANINLVWALTQSAWIHAIISAGLMLLSLVLQGKGHKIEETPSIPFSSPLNAISRLFVEQWINFPRFVVSGGWWQAFRSSK
ncbi:terminase [Undibacterium sp. LX40W]|uniref:Terminase n=1 Tax=Undibacterium nitidum TaxID=2762298 RepID=A0A923KTF8_9BURK|nr:MULTISPECIES: terminase [Undibacterium]MBC3882211.1 terminase [Undibacterium nitidum]MBC3892492.1 terminase [Undibacterium sp. LX40W]